MKVAIVGASGKTGKRLVSQALSRGYEVAAVCRDSSAHRIEDLSGDEACTVFSAPVVSDQALLTRALSGCNAVIAIPISVRKLRATDLVGSLAGASAANGVRRLVFTAGEMTAVPDAGEVLTTRQRIMRRVYAPIVALTPYSLSDMIRASVLVKEQPEWDWTIVRAPTLTEEGGAGYRLCEINEVTGKHKLSREDYAACMLDLLEDAKTYRRAVTVVGAAAA